jgi:hypothetical protein
MLRCRDLTSTQRVRPPGCHAPAGRVSRGIGVIRVWTADREHGCQATWVTAGPHCAVTPPAVTVRRGRAASWVPGTRARAGTRVLSRTVRRPPDAARPHAERSVPRCIPTSLSAVLTQREIAPPRSRHRPDAPVPGPSGARSTLRQRARGLGGCGGRCAPTRAPNRHPSGHPLVRPGEPGATMSQSETGTVRRTTRGPYPGAPMRPPTTDTAGVTGT